MGALLQRTGILGDEEFCEAKKEDQGTDCGDDESGEDAEDEDKSLWSSARGAKTNPETHRPAATSIKIAAVFTCGILAPIKVREKWEFRQD